MKKSTKHGKEVGLTIQMRTTDKTPSAPLAFKESINELEVINWDRVVGFDLKVWLKPY